MKKLILIAVALLIGLVSAQAKVVKITLEDGSTRVLTSSQLGSITFDDDGNMTAVTYNNQPIDDLTGVATQIEIDDEEEEFELISRQVEFGYQSTVLFTRDVKIINYVYPSVDPFGKPITLSGSIIIPENIWNGEVESEGILLVNHFTVADKNEAPTRGYYQLEGMYLANPLWPNYIVVESDFYGFGVTERFPQAYLLGQANAVATLDCLEPAKRLLEQRGIDYGPLLFNLGYSSGGFDAMATLKEADMNRPEEIHFDKTYAGGGPHDLEAVYRDYVEVDSIYYLCAVPLMIVAYNELGNLGLDYDEVFKPLLAEHVDDWILSKDYDTWTINGFIGAATPVSDMLQPDYVDLNSAKAKRVLQLFREKSIMSNWIPNTDNQIFLLHSLDDDYVTFKAARNLTDFLVRKGFQKNFIPGKTNFQTNLIMHDQGHISAMLIYIIQTLAQIKAWPYVHDGGLGEALYNKFLEQDLTVPGTIALLAYMKVDFKGLFEAVQAAVDEEGNINMLSFMIACNQKGIDIIGIIQALDDCGIDLTTLIQKITDIYTLLNGNASDAAPLKAMQKVDSESMSLIEQYELELFNWLEENNIKVF